MCPHLNRTVSMPGELGAGAVLQCPARHWSRWQDGEELLRGLNPRPTQRTGRNEQGLSVLETTMGRGSTSGCLIALLPLSPSSRHRAERMPRMARAAETSPELA
jgi:hypothetical protein